MELEPPNPPPGAPPVPQAGRPPKKIKPKVKKEVGSLEKMNAAPKILSADVVSTGLGSGAFRKKKPDTQGKTSHIWKITHNLCKKDETRTDAEIFIKTDYHGSFI